MTLGKRLKELRKTMEISQINMAKSLGIATSTYQHYERDESEASQSFFEKLITIYKLSPTWLLTGQGPMFLASTDRVASESPEDKESSLAVNALREDILAQKIVLMLREVDEEDRREILAYAEKAKQAAEERARLVAAEAKIAELERHMGKAAG